MIDIRSLLPGLLMITMGVACSTGPEQRPVPHDHGSGVPAKKQTPGTVYEAVNDTVHILLTGDDAMRFDQDVIHVRGGAYISLELRHTGRMAKDAMGHNFVLLKPGVDLPAFARAAMKEPQNDYIPKAQAGDVVAHTRMIGGGQRDVVVFPMPAKGSYRYLCSFPAHYGMMKGDFIVE